MPRESDHSERSEFPIAMSRMLAGAFVAGTWEPKKLCQRGALALGKRPRWLAGLACRIVAAFPNAPPPRVALVELFIRRDRAVQLALQPAARRSRKRLRPKWQPAPGAPQAWPVPEIADCRELAQWLELSLPELEWFADTKSLERQTAAGPLRHYHYRWKVKRSGEQRLLEAPKARLKELQRRILSGLLDRVPPHESAHGFRLRRSIKSFAAPHVGQRMVLKLDLADFFPSIGLAQIVALFRTLGYPDAVAVCLAGLCTNFAPRDCFRDAPRDWSRTALWRADSLYLRPHLPQGAPTSPALANLCAFRLDCRLAGLARSAGAVYTRYADDLAFSGGPDFERIVKRFHLHVCATVSEEGLEVNHRKTRFMRRGARQRLAGVVVNEHLNVERRDFDALKATLSNCVRLGPAGQNRDQRPDFRAHLAGRVAHVALLNAARGEKLRKVLERIEWS